MSESEVRRRSSLSRDYNKLTNDELDHHGRTSSLSRSVTQQQGEAYPGFLGSHENGRLSEDVEVVDMSRPNANAHSMGGYHQLPNGNASQRRKAGSGAGLLGLKRWQRNALLGAIALLVVIYFAQGHTSQALGQHDVPTSLDKAKVPDTVKATDGVVERPDWKEQVVGDDKQVDDASNANKHATPIKKPDSRPEKPVSESACRLPPGKPETQYALMIDAGSTGSRMHVYTFSNCLPEDVSISEAQDTLPTLKDELFYPITPGLSSYKGNPKAAAKSLQGLMEAAMKAVPKSERGCTPIAVKATAGLRLLGKKESQDILDEVERWLHAEWPFQVVENGVVIMDGKDEGVYAWITINYLLGLVGPGKDAGASAAVMDLGGASTQIVFEPSFPSNSKLSPGDHVYDLSFAATDHTLYQHSHLGYGLMQARRSVHNLVAFTHVWQSMSRGKAMEWEDLSADDLIPNPCLVKDGKKTVLLDPPGRPAVNVTFLGTGAGFEACRRVVDVVMAKDALCEQEPCAFGGVYQPQLMDTFGSGPIYALSYFYDRIVPLGLGKESEPFTIADLRDLSADVCAGPKPSGRLASSSKGWTRFKGNLEAMAELEDRPEYCLDLSFMYSLLSLGYELADSRELVTGKKIKDIELGWALGAGIALLEHSSLQCLNPNN